MDGTTIAKMELQGMVQCTRLILKAVKVVDVKVAHVVVAGDSMSSLMAVR